MQSERSDVIFCDDIFGETPVGVRKSVSSYVSYPCSAPFILTIMVCIYDILDMDRVHEIMFIHPE